MIKWDFLDGFKISSQNGWILDHSLKNIHFFKIFLQSGQVYQFYIMFCRKERKMEGMKKLKGNKIGLKENKMSFLYVV